MDGTKVSYPGADKLRHRTQLKMAGKARRHPCPSEEYGGAVGGSSTKMEQDAPGPNGSRASFSSLGKMLRGFFSLFSFS